MNKVTIAGTIRADIGLPAGIRILLDGGPAIDAVEKTIRIVEDNPEDWTVGTGGLPNLVGEVELDASIMDGKTLKAGAVAGVKHHKNPISIARKVMEETPHVLFMGEGADRFAELTGFEKSELLTQNARDMYRDFLGGFGIVQKDYDSGETMKMKERYHLAYEKLLKEHDLMDWYRKYAQKNHGTVNVIAKDRNGNICSGVSTSGLSFKLPGRMGDSSIIGAGNYADNRYGAATCVGVGEIAMRLCLARIAVYELSKGSTAVETAMNSIKSISDLEPGVGTQAVLIMDKNGDVSSASNFKNFYYWLADSENPEPVKKECLFVDIEHIEDGTPGFHR